MSSFSSMTPTPTRLTEPIGILGYGVEGRSTWRFLEREGYSHALVLDRKPPPELPEGLEYAGQGNYLARAKEVRTLIRSAGIRPDLPELVAFCASGGQLTSQIELFFERVSRDRIIAVTGTLGKGSCCSLLAHMLSEAGLPHLLGGNIGIAALDLLEHDTGSESFILELSSFQLSTLTRSPARAAILRTTVEHLDWHRDQAEYWQHKSHLVQNQRPGDLLVHHDGEGGRWIAAQAPSEVTRLSYGREGDWKIGQECLWEARADAGERIAALPPPPGPLCAAELRTKGHFQLENIAAAAALARSLGVDWETVLRAVRSFPGLEHRLEFVARKGNVDYYNDSYATRPEATLGALASFPDGDLGLVLGGSLKHVDFAELGRAVAQKPNLRAVALIGEAGPQLDAAIHAGIEDAQARHRHGTGCREAGPAVASPKISYQPHLFEALDFLRAEIREGAILMSPACASFGLFTDYKQRGARFREYVLALA